MKKNAPFPLRLYQQQEPARSAKGSISASYAETTSIEELVELDSSLPNQFLNLGGGYPPIFGSVELRTLIAKFIGVEREDVIVTNGIDDSVPSIYEALLNNEDTISLLKPTYDPIPKKAVDTGAQIISTNLEHDGIRWHLGKNGLATLFAEDIALCALNAPHNPTGWYPDASERKAIVKAIEMNDTLVIADEVYAGMPQVAGMELPSLATLSDQIISVGSLTKVFGLPGLRIGWIACTNPDIIEQIKNVRTFGHCYYSTLSEVAAITALRSANKIISKKVQIAQGNLRRLKEFVTRFPAFDMTMPEHGTVAMSYVDVQALGFESVKQLCEDLLAETGQILISSTFFDDPTDWVRFGFATRSFACSLAALESYLESRQ